MRYTISSYHETYHNNLNETLPQGIMRINLNMFYLNKHDLYKAPLNQPRIVLCERTLLSLLTDALVYKRKRIHNQDHLIFRFTPKDLTIMGTNPIFNTRFYLSWSLSSYKLFHHFDHSNVILLILDNVGSILTYQVNIIPIQLILVQFLFRRS